MTSEKLYLSPITGLDGEILWVVGDLPRGMSGIAFHTRAEAVEYFLQTLSKDLVVTAQVDDTSDPLS